MKNKFNKILIITSAIFIILILILALLGSVNRTGYLSDFKLNEDLSKKYEYNYDFRIKYYSKVFRNSDIYNVIFNVPQSVYIGSKLATLKNIGFDKKNVSPFANFTSNIELKYDDKIDNIEYKLGLKTHVWIVFAVAIIYIIYISLNNKLILNIYHNKKQLILKVSRISFISITVIFILLFILGKLNHKGSLEDLQLIAESEAGYIYKARINFKGLFSPNLIYKSDKLNIKNKSDYIKYGYNLEFNTIPWYDTKIAKAWNNEDGTFTISNSTSYNVYSYNLELSQGEKYIVTLEAKKIGENIGGVINYNLNSDANTPIPNTDKLTDNYKKYTSTLKIKEDKISERPAIRFSFPKGVINIKYIKIEEVSGNLYLKSENSIIFTSSQKIDDINSIGNLSYNLNINNYLIILFIIVISIMIFKYKIFNFFIDKNINIKLSTIMIMGYLYLILPYLIFIIGWTKYIISIPVSISIVILVYFMIKDTIKNYTATFNINLYIFILIVFLIVLVILLCGIGEIFPQGSDAKAGRNAMFRDLVNFSWPLIYSENGFGFVYYFAHWSVPAIFGKLLGFSVAKIVLIMWSSIGLFISFFLIILFINNKNNLFVIISLLIFILFDNLNYFNIKYFGYGSFIGSMTQLYNQYIGILVLGGLFLHQKNSSNFAFLGLSVIFYSPYTIITIFIFMLVKAIMDYKKNGSIELRNIFSKYNILFSILIFPIMYFYLSSLDGIPKEITFLKYDIPTFIKAALCKFGIFMFFLFKDNKKNYIFYISCFIFLLVPFIQFSSDHNFYRTNLLAYYFTIVLIIKYFSDNYEIKSIKKYIFIVIIILSFKGSLTTYESKIRNFIKNDFEFTKDIGKETLNSKIDSWVLKTVTCHNLDNSIFFKYIAKDKK